MAVEQEIPVIPGELEIEDTGEISFLEKDYFDQAYNCIESEEELLENEIRMFDKLRDDITPRPIKGSPGAIDREELEDVYRSQVYTDSDYFSEEFESLEESFEEELGKRASKVLEGEGELGAREKNTVIGGVETALKKRENLERMVEGERKTVGKLRESLSQLSDFEKIDRESLDWDQLTSSLDYLESMEGYVEELCDRRQQAIVNGDMDLDTTHNFIEYLYSDAEFNYPVLSILTETMQYISDMEREVEKAASDRGY